MKEFLHRHIVLSGATLLLMLLCVHPVDALEVSGALTGEHRWTVDDSPVQITGDVKILPDARLEIAPGVIVSFTGPYRFVVEGNLQAVGQSDAMIVFTAEQPQIDSLRWRGIRFVNADRDCQLSFCRVEYGWARGAWPEDRGGGIYIEGSSPTITRSEIVNNLADGDGGGIYGWFTTSTIHNNVIVMNYSRRFGGGIFMDYSSPSIINNTIALDRATAWGGGVYFGANGEPIVKNCIIAYNTQKDSLDGRRILSGNTFFPNVGNAHGSSHAVTFSMVEALEGDPYTGSGNIIDIPAFINLHPDSLDFHLQLNSPCVDAGDPQMSAANEPDILVNRVNMGAYGGTEEATGSKPVVYVSQFENNVILDFDSIKIETQISLEIWVANQGHYRLQIHDFQFSTPAFFPDSAENDDGEIMPSYQISPIENGERSKFVIQFRPLELITYIDTMYIVTSDLLGPTPYIVMIGTGINPVPSFRDTLNVSDTLDFSDRNLGADHLDSLYIKNIGDSELHISSVSVQGDGFESRIVDQDIARGDSGLVEFTFSPDIPQNYSAFASVRTNGGNIGLTLLGRGEGPRMVIDIEELFLGYVYTGGDTATALLPIANEGDDFLNITEITFSAPAFSVDLPVGGLAIADSDVVDLEIRFHPSEPNVDYEADMTIVSNYPVPETINLTGRGMAEPGQYMFGEVSGVWEWEIGNPDYIILDSVYVPAQSRLKIMPGTRILFEPGAFLQADGELRAVGTENDSIYFQPRDLSGTDEVRWNGLQLSLSDKTKLSYCVISGATVGIMIAKSSPLVQYSTIHSNADTSRDGGGIYMENSGANIHACTINGNVARSGGGICIVNSIPTITNCIIRDNQADQGGGILLRFLSSALIQSNLIFGNTGGGIVVMEHSAPRVLNNTIVENLGFGVTTSIRSMPILVNDIIWDNSSGALELGINSHALVSYCDVDGGTEGTANLDTLPQFIDHPDDPQFPYLLSESSVLVDRGNPEVSYRDFHFPPSLGTEINDIGAYGGPLGGGWQSPDVDVSVFQNPAFPQWLDIFVVSMDSMTTTPLCSLDIEGGERTIISLTALSSTAYRGSYEASRSGEIFITVDADLVDGHRKVGRTYLLTTLIEGNGGFISMVGVDGELTIPDGSFEDNLTIMTGYDASPIKPETDRLYLSPEFFIWGLDIPLERPAELRINIDLGTLSESDRDQVALFRRSGDGWIHVAGTYRDGVLISEIDSGGKFVIAWDVRIDGNAFETVPETPNLLTAYPNPFNRKVTIEFEIQKSSEILLAVYDLGGRRMATLADGYWNEGKHREVWNGKNSDGIALPSGLYWARLHSGNSAQSIKLLLLR